jgi:hypothetical protein
VARKGGLTVRTILVLLLAAGAIAATLAAPASPAPTAGASVVAPAFTLHPGPLPELATAMEPTLGVNPHTGALLYQAYTETWRVTFDDAVSPPTATWTRVTPPTSLINFDPILYTDKETGRTFAGGLNGPCSILSYTDDDGGQWIPVTNACSGPIDHERLASGPWNASFPGAGPHPRAVHYCAWAPGNTCATSHDGGLTFLPPVPVTGACSGLLGHVRIGPDGTAYVPFQSCGGRLGLAVTTTNGLTWVSRPSPASVPNTANPQSFDPAVGVTSGAPIYLAWQGTDARPMVAMSEDGGLTYPRITDLSATFPGIQVGTMPTVVGGDPDRAMVGWLGSAEPGNPIAPPWDGVWDLYASFTYDRGATWTTVKVTTDPLQRGWLCAGGTGCTTNRNLWDFFDATLDAEGRVLIGFADGCIDACALPTGTTAQSTSTAGVIARQAGGLGLLAAYD